MEFHWAVTPAELSSSPDDPRSPHIRRHPTGPFPRPEDTATHLIRRAPLGPPEPPATLIPEPVPEPAGRSLAVGTPSSSPGRTAIAAASVAMLSGWPTAGSEFLYRGVVVHQFDPPGAAEVDQGHRRLTHPGDFLDAAQTVLVVADPITGLERDQSPLARP
jgi:hypothetical protein